MRRILLVDDDPSIVSALRRAFEAFGYAVATAADGRQAMDRLSESPFDGLVLDLQMDPIDGWAVLEESRRLSAPPVTILLSGYLDVPSTVAAVRAGAFDVLEKPVASREIERRLREAWNQREEAMPDPIKVASTPVADAAQRILGDSPEVRHLQDQVRSVARFVDVSVLIVGETGTGKEVVAEAIHRLSGEKEPFVAVNCAAIPEALFESELFGHEAGAFTGARGTRIGLLEAAGAGSLFLDEVGELPLALQPKLLRALEDRTFRRVGGKESVPFRARIISATNRMLIGSDVTGMRPDLYFRLAGFTIQTTALRERAQDIGSLASHFLESFSHRYPDTPSGLDAEAIAALRAHDWPGNVRELRRVVEHAAMMASGAVIGSEVVQAVLLKRRPPGARIAPAQSGSYNLDGGSSAMETESERPGSRRLRDVERELILGTFEGCDRNLSRASRALGIPRTTLRDRLRRYGVR